VCVGVVCGDAAGISNYLLKPDIFKPTWHSKPLPDLVELGVPAKTTLLKWRWNVCC
jgi:hypothetical protein